MNNAGNENEMTVANNYVTEAQIAARRWSPIEELPAIFFAKVGAAVMLNRKRLCRFPFLLDNNTMAYSLSKEFWDADFAKALFETVDLTSLVQVGALPSYNAGDVEAMEVKLPKVSEQRLVGAYFRQLDILITLHQREESCAASFSASCFGTLKAFFWEQRKLSEVFSSYTDPVDIPHDGYERLGIRSHAKGTFHNYVPAGHELQTAQMHRVAANKFIVNITFGWEHAVAVTDENDAGKLVSHRFPQFSLSDELDPQFLKFIILDERFRHHLWLASPGGAGRNRVLNLNQMLQYEIQIPCVAEQRKIAGALINIDILITLHQCKPKSRKGGSHVLYSYQV